MNQRVLVVDDEPTMLSLLHDDLTRRGYSVTGLTSASGALALLADQDFDVVLCDIQMQGTNGIDLCRQLKELREDVPVIMITGYASAESAIGAIRARAFDFVTKPFRTDDLVRTLERALEQRGSQRSSRLPRAPETPQTRPNELAGESAAVRRLYAVIARVAPTDATALVTGESGTGKELVARAIHARSARCGGPFVGISCAAMPEALLESELFGHEKGAFTDASASKAGLLSCASGGTLFLDEVGEMPPGMQSKLLRALQERKVRAVGASKEVPFDTRIIAATNRDLEDEVARGRFREDLFYRLNVVHVHVPALRERDDDVLLLARMFLQRYSARGRDVSSLTEEAAECLLSYDWPGNVRELQNCIERAVALAQHDCLGVRDLPNRIRHHSGPRSAPVPAGDESASILPLEVVERRHIAGVLQAMGGNKASAARALGLARRTLYRKLRRWRGEDPEAPRSPRE